MNLSDLLPTSSLLSSIEGVEKRLLERRRNGTLLGTATLILAAAIELLALVTPGIQKIVTALGWKTGPLLILAPVILGAVVYYTIRYTGVLLKESKEPFRYTFFVNPFVAIAGSPGDRFKLTQDDVLKLIQYDLMERLNRRIMRLSLLHEPPQPDGSKDTADVPHSPSHIHIEGEYAIREDSEGNWVLHVMPRVRIGPATNPFTLAFSVRYRLDLTQPPQTPPAAVLRTEQYEQLLERVYSSVATEIYRQIKADVENKIKLFPGAYLRAVALYCEARDFENSNTIDSYDRAIELYEAAKRKFATSLFFRFRIRFARFFASWVRPAMHAQAIALIGHSRCLIYRRMVSELTGRRENPIFEIREELENGRNDLIRCYNSLMPREDLQLPLDAEVDVVAVTAVLSGLEPEHEEEYRSLREELCEAFAVTALGYCRLLDSQRGRGFLKNAKAFAPESDANRSLLLLAESGLEQDLERRVTYLRYAKDISPESEIICFWLAVSLDNLARLNDDVTQARAEMVRRAYGTVLIPLSLQDGTNPRPIG